MAIAVPCITKPTPQLLVDSFWNLNTLLQNRNQSTLYEFDANGFQRAGDLEVRIVTLERPFAVTISYLFATESEPKALSFQAFWGDAKSVVRGATKSTGRASFKNLKWTIF